MHAIKLFHVKHGIRWTIRCTQVHLTRRRETGKCVDEIYRIQPDSDPPPFSGPRNTSNTQAGSGFSSICVPVDIYRTFDSGYSSSELHPSANWSPEPNLSGQHGAHKFLYGA